MYEDKLSRKEVWESKEPIEAVSRKAASKQAEEGHKRGTYKIRSGE